MSIQENFWSSFCYCLDKVKHFIFRSWYRKTISYNVNNAIIFHCKLVCAGRHLFEHLLLDFVEPELLFYVEVWIRPAMVGRQVEPSLPNSEPNQLENVLVEWIFRSVCKFLNHTGTKTGHLLERWGCYLTKFKCTNVLFLDLVCIARTSYLTYWLPQCINYRHAQCQSVWLGFFCVGIDHTQ